MVVMAVMAEGLHLRKSYRKARTLSTPTLVQYKMSLKEGSDSNTR